MGGQVRHSHGAPRTGLTHGHIISVSASVCLGPARRLPLRKPQLASETSVCSQLSEPLVTARSAGLLIFLCSLQGPPGAMVGTVPGPLCSRGAVMTRLGRGRESTVAMTSQMRWQLSATPPRVAPPVFCHPRGFTHFKKLPPTIAKASKSQCTGQAPGLETLGGASAAVQSQGLGPQKPLILRPWTGRTWPRTEGDRFPRSASSGARCLPRAFTATARHRGGTAAS